MASGGGLGTGPPLHQNPGYGVLFRLDPPASPGTPWRFDVLHAFHGESDGEEPLCDLMATEDETIHGTTYEGGANSLGTAFSYYP